MIIPLDKLVSYNRNRYILTRAAMCSVDRIESLTEELSENERWKIVPGVLRMILEEKIQYEVIAESTDIVE